MELIIGPFNGLGLEGALGLGGVTSHTILMKNIRCKFH